MKFLFKLALLFVVIYGGYWVYDNYIVTEDLPEVTDEQKEQVKHERVFIEEWEDYKNEEYGFSIQHPVDWEVQESLKPQQERALHEIDIHEVEYDMVRSNVVVQIFDNSVGDTVATWWDKWLGEEDQKEAECKMEYEDTASCLFLRGLIEEEKDGELYGLSVKTVQLFQFDSSKECNYVAYGDYVYGICHYNINPNDPDFEKHYDTTVKMISTFIFDDLLKKGELELGVPSEEGLGFEQFVPGTWQSTDDEMNIMVLKEDGVVENIYDNEIVGSGTWTIEGYKLKMMIDGDEEEFVYTVVFAGSERLKLTYLARGNTLNFTRVVEE